jgi:HB1, ASXL, restriction endonuclease HTH domain
MATKKTTKPAEIHGQPAVTEAAPERAGTDTTVAKAAELETTGADVPGNHQRTIPFKGKGAAKPRSKKPGKPNAHSAAIQAETAIPKSQKPAPQAKKAEFHDNKLSALDAAAKVLQEAGQPMNCQEMIAAMAAKGYWSSPAGQTPASTLYSALSREIKIKGNQARFQKTARGQFAYQTPKAS